MGLEDDVSTQEVNYQTSIQRAKKVSMHAYLLSLGEGENGYASASLEVESEPEFFYKPFTVIGIVLIACTGIGLFYLLAKWTIIRPGELGITQTLNGQTKLKAPGSYLYLSPFTWFEKTTATTAHYNVNDLHIINIKTGEIGIGNDLGKVKLLPPGQHAIRSSTFIYVGARHQNEAYIDCGDIKMVNVHQNEITVMNNGSGERLVLQQGFYAFENAGAYTIERDRIKLNQTEIPFSIQGASQDGFVVKVDAKIFYVIENPDVALHAIQNIAEHIKGIAECELSTAISKKGIMPPARIELDQNDVEDDTNLEESPPRYSAFQNQVQNASLEALQQRYSKLGINIVAIQPSSVKILNEHTAQALGDAAVSVVKANADQTNAAARQAVQIIEAQTIAQTTKIQAEAEARATQIQADADAAAIVTRAGASATAIELISKKIGELHGKEAGAQAAGMLVASDVLAQKQVNFFVTSGPNGFGPSLVSQLSGQVYANQDGRLRRSRSLSI